MFDLELRKTDPIQILVVDDTPANLKLLTDILTYNGYQVRPASSGRIALRSVLVEIPDLILLDIKMPEMDGYEVCKQLKDNPVTKNIPVVFISALDEMADKVKGFNVGGIDFITKPFQAEEVLIRVETHISIHRLRNELQVQNNHLQQEIIERKRVEEELLIHKTHLEDLVVRRTEDLNNSYLQLQQDIHEKEALEKELMKALDKSEESDRLKSSLLSNMNHEFRTPITGILGMASVLKEMTHDTKKLHMLNCIVDSSRRLMKTLNAILEFAQVEANVVTKNFKDINIVRVAENIISDANEKIKQRGLTLVVDLPGNPVYVHAGERIISQILMNIVDNAIKFTDKGEIKISIADRNINGKKFAEIKITDTGIGIASEYLDVIFEEFRQVSEGLSRSYEGVGLGLTLVKKLVGVLKGEVSVESELEKGTAFTVIFPSVRSAAEYVEMQLESPVLTEIQKKNKPEKLPVILLVEDNIINIEVIDVFLMDICKVDYVRTGEDAIEIVKSNKYPLILMDINLGVGLDGVETTRIIKKLRNYENTSIVALTGYAMESDREKFLKEGFSHYLPKPFDKKDLISLVEEIFVREGIYN